MIAGSVQAADKDIHRTQHFIGEAQDAILRAERAISRASDYIDNEGREALKQAKLATEKFGTRSEKMKNIATKAMLTAKQYVK